MADESDFQLQNSAKAIEFSIETVKAGMLINGGAAVAILAFMSSDGRPKTFNPTDLKAAVVWFCVGLSCAFAASICGYFSQTRFAVANARMTKIGNYSDGWARFWAIFGTCLIVACLGSFLWGAAQAYAVISKP